MLGLRELLVVSGTRAQRVAQIANHQRGRINRRQLLEAGLTDAIVCTMLASGQLHKRHRGVYTVGHAAPVDLGRETEALLAAPEGAVLSHKSAAALWGLIPPRSGSHPVDITVPNETSVHRRGIRVHRTRALHPKDIRIHKGLPVTSPARALLEIAGDISGEELENALDDALNRNRVRPGQMRDVLDRAGHGRRGAKRLTTLLEQRDKGGRSRSRPERTLRQLIVAAELHGFEMNARILNFDVDFVWPELRVIVEDDSLRFHTSRAMFESDRRRDQILEAHGWTVIRITARQIRDQPYAVIARLSATLALARMLRQAA